MMQNTCTLSYDANPNAEDIDQLTQGLADYAKQKKGLSPIKPFAFWLKEVAVGTVIANSPPHRSQRAELLH